MYKIPKNGFTDAHLDELNTYNNFKEARGIGEAGLVILQIKMRPALASFKFLGFIITYEF